MDSLVALIGSKNLCSRRWVWEQYDTMIQGNTKQRPGGDAGVIRVDGTQKGLAFTVDVTPRYCKADPFEGGKQAVAESWRNLNAVGAEPLATTDNLNFGNPEKPEIMGQFVGCIKGVGAACEALDMPSFRATCPFTMKPRVKPSCQRLPLALSAFCPMLGSPSAMPLWASMMSSS